MSSSVRAELAAQFTQDWASIPALAVVRVLATERNLGPQSVPLAIIRRRSVSRFPQAPLEHRNVGILVTLVASHDDPDNAADELDTLVDAALDYLDTRFRYDGEATAVQFDQRLAYDIPLTIIATKE